nr:unnamed protein product [Spirometra erinaceieuropaei]
MDTLKSYLKRVQVNPTNWDDLSQNRPKWRRTFKTGAAVFEANRIAAAEMKRKARKSNLRRRTTASNVSSMSTDNPRTNFTYCTPPDELHLSDRTKHPSTPPPLPRPLRVHLTLTALLNRHFHPPNPRPTSPPSSSVPIFFFLLLLILLLLILLLFHCPMDDCSAGRQAHIQP